MGTMNPRPRGVATERSDRKANRNDREQIRRAVTRRPRVEPPATGGILGISHVYVDDVHIETYGTTHYIMGATTTVEGYIEDGAPPLVSGITVDNVNWPGYFNIGEEGKYSFRVITRCALDKASEVPLAMLMALQRDAVYNDHEKMVNTFDGNAAGVPNGTVSATEQAFWDDWTIGPQWVQAGERCNPRLTAKLATPPTIGPNGASFAVEVTRWA